jgi:hypothetical protein
LVKTVAVTGCGAVFGSNFQTWPPFEPGKMPPLPFSFPGNYQYFFRKSRAKSQPYLKDDKLRRIPRPKLNFQSEKSKKTFFPFLFQRFRHNHLVTLCRFSRSACLQDNQSKNPFGSAFCLIRNWLQQNS